MAEKGIPTTKICPFCAEEIKYGAQICRHCLSYQKGYSMGRAAQALRMAASFVCALCFLAAIWMLAAPVPLAPYYEFPIFLAAFLFGAAVLALLSMAFRERF